MSKKILKRSLALGALMAFVITGSAMAEGVIDSATENITRIETDKGEMLYGVSENGTTKDFAALGTITVSNNKGWGIRGVQATGDASLTFSNENGIAITVKDIVSSENTSSKRGTVIGAFANNGILTFDTDVSFNVESKNTQKMASGIAANIAEDKIYFNGKLLTDIQSTNSKFTAQGAYLINGADVYFNSLNTNITAKSDYGVSGLTGGGIAHFGSNDGVGGQIDSVNLKVELVDGDGCNAIGVMSNLNVGSNVESFNIEVIGSGTKRPRQGNGTAAIYTGYISDDGNTIFGKDISINSKNLYISVEGSENWEPILNKVMERDNTYGIKVVKGSYTKDGNTTTQIGSVTIGKDTTTTITVNDNGKGEVAGTAYGVYAEGGATVSVLGDTTISATGGEAKESYSVYAKDNGTTVTVGSKGKDLNLTGTIASDYGSAVTLNGKDIVVNAYRNGTYDFAGIRVGDDSKIAAGSVKIGPDVENLTINATWGIYAFGNMNGTPNKEYISGENGKIDIDSTNITINSDSYGVLLNQGGIVNFGTDSKKVENLTINAGLTGSGYAMYTTGDSQINVLANNVKINAEKSNCGLFVHRGTINIGNEENLLDSILVKANNNTIYVKDNSTKPQKSTVGLFAKTIDLQTVSDDGTCISTNKYDDNDDGTVVTVSASEKLNIVGDIISGAKTSIIDINKDINNALVTIDGDIIANEGTISLNLGTTGSTLTSTITDSANGVNLNLNKGTWIVTGDSLVNKLECDGGAITVNNLAESQVDVISNASTNLTVNGTAAVADEIANSTNTSDALQKLANTVVTTNTSNEKVAVANFVTTEEGLVGGAYSAQVDKDGKVVTETITQAVNTKSDAVSDAGMALKGHWRAHMNDMNKRMGDLRMANGETGVWTRMVRGESEYQGAKMQYNQYQLGYDEKLSVDKRWTVGAAVTFSEGDASYAQGSTDDKSTAFAIYGSKLNNDGTFVDLIARYAHLESDLEDRVYGNGDYSTNGMSVSAEFGKRIEQGNGLWIEPQVELTYGTIDSADVVLGNKYKAHYDSLDSFIARAGLALGKDIKQGNVYARASYLYDFDGETTTQFEGGKPIEEDFGGGWWEVGLGANINLSKATYIYADIEKTFGGEVDTNWQWNLGVRYSF